MIFRLKDWDAIKRARELFEKLVIERKTIEIKVVSQKRTDRQLRSIWLLCDLVAKELNDAGMDIRLALKEDLEVSWTKTLVMDIYFRTIQKTLFGTESTGDLETDQPSKIYEELNRHLSKLGIHIPFPNFDHNIEY